jgi:hypothetical protein
MSSYPPLDLLNAQQLVSAAAGVAKVADPSAAVRLQMMNQSSSPSHTSRHAFDSLWKELPTQLAHNRQVSAAARVQAQLQHSPRTNLAQSKLPGLTAAGASPKGSLAIATLPLKNAPVISTTTVSSGSASQTSHTPASIVASKGVSADLDIASLLTHMRYPTLPCPWSSNTMLVP